MSTYPTLPAGSTIVPAPADLTLARYQDNGEHGWSYPVVALASIPTEGGVGIVPLVVKGGGIVRADEAAPIDRTRLVGPDQSIPARIPPVAVAVAVTQ
ncbi:hypothetical protein [Rhodococcus aetherivorans]|uniref:hypothetical protein n=1 Tax=Rhodococcus aetherivorans TaxID=191292 RepID=UPI00045CDBC9|nr:hypothetical protein [Rhodococcus aetherivorans]KDE12424.1 hypothetical protein N505_0115360 [Rhodococcus aetherivorans]